jgi:hypothetical protein
MRKETWVLDEIEIGISGFFTTHHTFKTQRGTIGEMTFPAFSQQGSYRAFDGRELSMLKTHWLGRSHEMRDGKVVRGRADPTGLFQRDLAISFDGQSYSLIPEGILRQGWFLVDALGQTLLEIQPRGVFRQGAYLTIKAPLDADLMAFAYYLYYMLQQEAAAAAAAS